MLRVLRVPVVSDEEKVICKLSGVVKRDELNRTHVDASSFRELTSKPGAFLSSGISLQVNIRMPCKRCPAYSGRDSLLGFLRELREPVVMMFKGEIQIGKTMSMRVPMHGTGTELLIVVMKYL